MSHARRHGGTTWCGVSVIVVSCMVSSQGLSDGSAVASDPSGPSKVSPAELTDAIAPMTQIRALAAKGRGTVGIILPNAAVAALDGADLEKAFSDAGLRGAHVALQQAGDSGAFQFADAEHDISTGAKVLVLDPINSGVGTQIETYAAANGVKTIDFDELSLGGSRAYFVGYDDVAAGRMLAQGLASCLTSWHVKQPHLIVMSGPTNDGTATELADGYNSALHSFVKHRHWVDVAQTVGTWDPSTAVAEFQTAYEGNHHVNAALVSNDAADGAVIGYLKTAHVPPHTFPTTGYGATLAGLRQILDGYQCGTIYSPPAHEAQAAAALALYLRANVRPPARLVNGQVEDTTAGVTVPSVLVDPQWVTKATIAATVVKNGDVAVSQLCSGAYAGKCRAAGIRP